MGLVLKNVNITGGKLQVNTPPKWWTRNPDWLPFPNVVSGNNVFYGLYAVFENGLGANVCSMTIATTGTNNINWGDGVIEPLINGSNSHTYNYSALPYPILVSDDGRYYKQVLIQFSLTLVTDIDLTLNTLIRNTASGWLDIVCAGVSLRRVLLSGVAATQRKAEYIERLKVVQGNFANGLSLTRSLWGCRRLKVFEYPFTITAFSLESFTNSGDFRLDNGNPLDLDRLDASIFGGSFITKIGNVNIVGAQTATNAFNSSLLEEIGNINVPSVTSLFSFFSNCVKLRKVGTITVGTALTSIQSFANNSNLIPEIIFTGNMSNVTVTANAFISSNITPTALRRLIMPGLRVGFNIQSTQITGQNLQDLFTSLGTANGAQTITLPTFTTGESTTIATGKGYTIAYA